MGLKTDIKNAYEELLSSGGNVSIELTEQQLDNIDRLAENLTEGFKQFLSKQTFEITEMQAFVELDEFETSLPQPANIVTAKGETASWPSGVVGSLQPVIIGKQSNVIEIPKINFNKYGTSKQGGNLKAIGHAYLGNPLNNPSLYDEFDTKGDNEGWNQFSKVKLNYDTIVEDE